MKRETTLKDSETGIDYPVEITYEIEHNDGNYPDDYDIDIEEIRVPVVCQVPSPPWSGFWTDFEIMIDIYPTGNVFKTAALEHKAIARIRECIEGDRIEAEERGKQE